MDKLFLHQARRHRGQIEAHQLSLYISHSDFQLSILLVSTQPHERTIGARLLGQRLCLFYIKNLCDALKIEQCLYPRLAICEALVNMGSACVSSLSKLIGKVGNNHETKLPIKYFRKNSYPLARDIAVRTLINIGDPAIDCIINLTKTNDDFYLSQLIDALGGLLHKTKDLRIVNELRLILDRVKPYELLEWKIIRAFSAADNIDLSFMMHYLDHPQPSIRWETIRTLGMVGYSNPKLLTRLKELLLDSNEEVRLASHDALIRISKK